MPSPIEHIAGDGASILHSISLYDRGCEGNGWLVGKKPVNMYKFVFVSVFVLGKRKMNGTGIGLRLNEA